MKLSSQERTLLYCRRVHAGIRGIEYRKKFTQYMFEDVTILVPTSGVTPRYLNGQRVTKDEQRFYGLVL